MRRKGGGLKSSKTVTGLLVVFLILVILISVFFGFNRFRKEGFDNNNNKFILVHMNGCGHCKDLMPIWEEASQSNTTPIRMKVVEMNEPEGKKLCDEHDIKSFPTMILIKNNTTTMYDGNRTKEGLLSFLNSNI
jgi:thiol-disulfide isomerase/thioredoxin